MKGHNRWVRDMTNEYLATMRAVEAVPMIWLDVYNIDLVAKSIFIGHLAIDAFTILCNLSSCHSDNCELRYLLMS